MNKWAKETNAERETLFLETAARTGISAEIIEKDFWVCWVLYQIFAMTDIPRVIFKGGTSLSKIFKVIERFSEDIDVSIDRGSSWARYGEAVKGTLKIHPPDERIGALGEDYARMQEMFFGQPPDSPR